jgi:hypothetical protein
MELLPCSPDLKPNMLRAKLQAALDYLGDKLVTHRASRYKPRAHYLLDEWRARRPGHFGTPLRLVPAPVAMRSGETVERLLRSQEIQR